MLVFVCTRKFKECFLMIIQLLGLDGTSAENSIQILAQSRACVAQVAHCLVRSIFELFQGGRSLNLLGNLFLIYDSSQGEIFFSRTGNPQYCSLFPLPTLFFLVCYNSKSKSQKKDEHVAAWAPAAALDMSSQDKA